MSVAPTTRETADHIGEANEKVAHHNGDATTMIDHAELKRLAEAATPGPWKSIIDDTGGERSGWPLCIVPENGDDRSVVRTGGMWPYEWDAKVSQHEAVSTAAFIAAANPATVLALLSEIAALRGDLTVSRDDLDQLQAHFRQRDREATQAERQRDELRKALEDHDQTAAECRIDGARPQRDTTAPCELCGATQRESCGRKGSAAYAFTSSARTLLANQGADQ